jgi:hypothetical protein
MAFAIAQELGDVRRDAPRVITLITHSVISSRVRSCTPHTRAVEATNGPAVQSLTWTSPHHRPIFAGKNRNRAAADF